MLYKSLSKLLALITALLFPLAALGQSVQSKQFSHNYGHVCYKGVTRCSTDRVIIESTLQLFPPKPHDAENVADKVKLSVIESFRIPEGLQPELFWDAMTAKQLLTVAQGYFLLATRYYAVQSPKHKAFLSMTRKCFLRARKIFLAHDNSQAANDIDRAAILVDGIMQNTDSSVADRQFSDFYVLYDNLVQTCVQFDDNDCGYRSVAIDKP